jgi:hypothetical protein
MSQQSDMMYAYLFMHNVFFVKIVNGPVHFVEKKKQCAMNAWLFLTCVKFASSWYFNPVNMCKKPFYFIKTIIVLLQLA